VILTDEPTASVDQETREVIVHHLLIEAKAGGKIVVLATHAHGLVPNFDKVERLSMRETNLLTVGREAF
jgi:ABC-type lipoprotein export system ATPase subunit